MTISSQLQTNERLAALTLHALAHVDQQWLLSQLPEAHAQRLKSLIEELVELGIPSDPSIVDAVTASSDVTFSDSQPPDGWTELPHACIYELLSSETVGFVARALSFLQADTAEAVIQYWAQSKRAEIQAALQALPESMPTMLKSAIMHQLKSHAAVSVRSDLRVAR